ncbi:CBS domain-containing protein [Flavobacterium sp. JP2137]|uniref:CBS domain-containing protein n=1 Tax=Flavobacterium sp. JP2137 TaxID=3414510 RepID=UPI003D2FD2FE
MKQRIPVSTIMTANVIKLNLTDNLTKAESLFKKHKIRHIPVVSGNTIIGMLSYTDLLRVSLADSVGDFDEDIDVTVYNMFSIEQVMAKELVTIQVDANIKEAVEILSKEEFRALPVLDGDLLVGILTTTDLLKYLLKQYD